LAFLNYRLNDAVSVRYLRASVNEQVVHGISNDKPTPEGDILFG